MSTNLYWNPTPKPKNGLSDEFKYAFRKRFGSVGTKGWVLGREHLSWLQGLEDAGIKDASKVIEVIDKYEEILLWET